MLAQHQNGSKPINLRGHHVTEAPKIKMRRQSNEKVRQKERKAKKKWFYV